MAVHYLGIRHHGPGSARQVVQALDSLKPSSILIEGASDLSGLISLLAHDKMRPPVALLSYPKDEPEAARFWPFAEFSPEYQAIQWAVAHNALVRFIDLPSYWLSPEEVEVPDELGDPEDDFLPEEDISKTSRDPIGALAEIAGYSDGESWWNEIIEENPEPGPVFEAVASAMEVLRENAPPLSIREAAREAHMRIEINKEQKAIEGEVAVVCGAYHVPALKEKHTLKDDRVLIKSASKRKMLATWAPWTSPRLATLSGYGAGVTAPNWYSHLWKTPREQVVTLWLVKVARTLRDSGYFVPSASVIEAERLAVSLAVIRERAIPGYDELREASISCLCNGEPALWTVVEEKLLIGNEVGEIPNEVPLAPLLEDLTLQQKKTRLKPDALDRDLSLDLRSESGLLRSTLLHRLTILGVDWGVPQHSGRSRGTFRENWRLRWEPEYAVELVENLIYGSTIAQATAGKLHETFRIETSLQKLASTILNALTAQLSEAAHYGITRLREQAAQSSDCKSLLETLAPIADILRYGEARSTDSAEMGALFNQIITQGALSLSYACHNLDAEASQGMKDIILDADRAVRLILNDRDQEFIMWEEALKSLLRDDKASRLIVGSSARLLYEAESIPADETVTLIERQLSPGTPIADAADFFEGFFEGSGSRLIHDESLRIAVNNWLVSLEEESFIEHLPLFRRVFSSLDKTERSHLLNALFGKKPEGVSMMVLIDNHEPVWKEQSAAIAEFFKSTPC